MRKKIIVILLVMIMILGLIGCQGKDQQKKIEITLYLWDKEMTREFTPWLESKFPEINFTFVVGYNAMDYYKDLVSRGSLPDIITCRRFSLNDATSISDNLMDLSETDVVGSFYDSYIENNREAEGAIRWLPMCAEVDGYVANADIFKEYDIPIPTNYEEFVYACDRFDELGIKCYINDYREDYSCMEALQGCAIPELMTMDGVIWRNKYENEDADDAVGLDDKVWPAVFDKFEQYMKDTKIEPEDVEMCFADMKAALVEGECAIMRATANDCVTLREQNGLNTVMLPYYGQDSNSNWLLTYPTCQVAVNKAVEQDKEKNDAVIKVLEAMFSEEGQHHVAADNAVLSYNKNVDIELSDVFSEVTDCINSNHMYIRLASTEMFSVSKDVIQKMIRGEYGAEEAYKDFNAQLTVNKDKEVFEKVTTQNTAYEYSFGQDGIAAASAVVNTLRKQIGSDIAIGYSSVVTAPVFEGEYTLQQLNWLIANRQTIRTGQLTGSEVIELMEWLVNVKEDGSNPIRHNNLIPVTSGMEYELEDNEDGTYKLGKVIIDGKEIDNNTEYSVSIFGDSDYIEAPIYCNCPMPQNLSDKLEFSDDNIYTLFSSALESNKQIEKPTDYVIVLYK